MPGAGLRVGLIMALSSSLGGCSASAPPPARCVVSEEVAYVSVSNVDRGDVLFVIDDTPSMAGAQAQLQRELPVLVQMLATGELSATERFAPIEDLQVGVVSATFADGGLLHRVPAVGGNGCAAEYPGFLRYRGPYFGSARDDPATFAQACGCMAQLGADAQGPSQPLEAALSALTDPAAAPRFLRNDSVQGLSMIMVVVMTDVDDCSASGDAASGSPPSSTAECAAREDALQSLERYVQGLQALRAGSENLVYFVVIAGVPPGLVYPPLRARVDFSVPTQAAAYYDRILNAPAMQAVPDPAAPGRLQPACKQGDLAAEPGRRLIRLAQAFGANGLAISICSGGWGASVLPLVQIIGKLIGPTCLPHTFERGPDGRVDCKVFWDLPPKGFGPPSTPTACSERPFLSPAVGKPQQPGAQRCEVRQVAISNDAELGAADPEAGFYYDDFSHTCPESLAPPGVVQAKIAFTDLAVPPTGVSVTRDCFTARVEAPADAGTQSFTACDVVGPSDARWRYAAVGKACMPAEIPSRGFDNRNVWIETAASDCRTGVCMVYHLQGDPRPGCAASISSPISLSAQCADAHEKAERMYCSCRCAGAGPNSCLCPSGYSCREVLAQGPPEIAGSYCVKDGTLAEP